jgi:hypothetical protein
VRAFCRSALGRRGLNAHAVLWQRPPFLAAALIVELEDEQGERATRPSA